MMSSENRSHFSASCADGTPDRQSDQTLVFPFRNAVASGSDLLQPFENPDVGAVDLIALTPSMTCSPAMPSYPICPISTASSSAFVATIDARPVSTKQALVRLAGFGATSG
uniref:Uncharacterized protein n=1 Tax=Rhizobium leguminosarum TaxID=384 RepID=A0A179BDT2_RHILE|nr:hypothetical protein A4U53_06895 [Rhizobium leguminosarum]